MAPRGRCVMSTFGFRDTPGDSTECPSNATESALTRYDSGGNTTWADRHLAAPVDPLTTSPTLETGTVAVNDSAMPGSTVAPPTRIERRASLLRSIRDVAHERETLKRHEADLVSWARAEGIAWADIGEALGMTAKGARAAEVRRRNR